MSSVDAACRGLIRSILPIRCHIPVAPSSERLSTEGALRFVRGNAAYAAGYDANGNMTYRCTQDSGLVFTWDEENHLTCMDRSTGNVAIFGYRCDGLSSGICCAGCA